MKFESQPSYESNQFIFDTWFEHWINEAGYDLITDFEDDSEWAVVPLEVIEEQHENLEMEQAADLYEEIIRKLTQIKPKTDWRAVIKLDQTFDEEPVFRIDKTELKKLDLLSEMAFKPEAIGDLVLIAQSVLEAALHQIAANTVGVDFDLKPMNQIGTQRLFQVIRINTDDQSKQLGASREVIEMADYLAKAKLQELYPDTNWSAAISSMVDNSGGFLICIDQSKFQESSENNDE